MRGSTSTASCYSPTNWTGTRSSIRRSPASAEGTSPSAGDFTSYYAQEFGTPGTETSPTFLLGVVYDDSNGNSFYTPGEGRAKDLGAVAAGGFVGVGNDPRQYVTGYWVSGPAGERCSRRVPDSGEP